MTALRNAVAPWPTGSVLQRVSLKSREVANTACRHSNSRSAEPPVAGLSSVKGPPQIEQCVASARTAARSTW